MVNFVGVFQIIFGFVVAILDLVHDVEIIHTHVAYVNS